MSAYFQWRGRLHGTNIISISFRDVGYTVAENGEKEVRSAASF